MSYIEIKEKSGVKFEDSVEYRLNVITVLTDAIVFSKEQETKDAIMFELATCLVETTMGDLKEMSRFLRELEKLPVKNLQRRRMFNETTMKAIETILYKK